MRHQYALPGRDDELLIDCRAGQPHGAVHPVTVDTRLADRDVDPTRHRTEGKRCAETLFFDYWRQHRLRIKVARIFNTYGPRMHPNDGRVVSNFVVQALLGRDITVYGEGSQTRSFCYVDDLVDGLMRLMQTGDDITGPINIGNPNEVSIRELAQLIIEMTGSSARLVHRPLPQDDPRQRQPDISRAQEHLGWKPSTPLRAGLARTIAYFEELLRSNDVLASLSATKDYAESASSGRAQ